MNKKTKLKIILIYGILFLIGITFPMANIVVFFVYLGMALMIAVTAFILLLFALLDKKALKNAVFAIIAFVVFVGSAWSSELIITHYNKNKAKEIIEKLENYKTIQQEYPRRLEELELQNPVNNVTYDSNTKTYTLVLNISDINRQEYDSETKQWNGLGRDD